MSNSTNTPPKACTRAEPGPSEDESAGRLIDQRIRELGVTALGDSGPHAGADPGSGPEIAEEWKWTVPVWSHHGIACIAAMRGSLR